jgi:hypothetical protein
VCTFERHSGRSELTLGSMVLWKHYIILFGGFIDVGVKSEAPRWSGNGISLNVPANYLSDLWIFDTEEFRWKQIEYLDPERSPG